MRILLSNISKNSGGLATLHHIGFVFQDYALFRHMIDSDNVTFGIRVKDKKVPPSETETAKTTHALLDVPFGALIRIELTKHLPNSKPKLVYVEMLNEQFKQLQLSRGDKVDLKIRHAHWFY